MYTLKSKNNSIGINLPTSFDEITPEILERITKNVKLSDHYTLVALIYRTSLFKLAAQVVGGKADESISVTPVIAKHSDCVGSPVKESLTIPIIAPSVLERAFEVYIPTAASVNKVMSFIQEDNELRVSLFQKKYTGNLEANGITEYTPEFVTQDNNTNVYILGFKAVADNDIIAEIPLHNNIVDPYTTTDCKASVTE